MKLQTGFLIALSGAFIASAQAELNWVTDFEAAKKTAAQEDKSLLVDFTGSDWCGWCIKLKEEVFDKEAFAKAADEYVFVEVDFPNDESLITAEQRAANEALGQKYGIQGFPSILLMDAKGRPFARTGYQEGGPEAYLSHLEEISEPYQKLEKAEGEGEAARKEALVTFLKSVPLEDVSAFFKKELAELKKLDPEDGTGVVAEMEKASQMAEFENNAQQYLTAGEFDKILKMTEDYLAKNKPEGEDKQHILMANVMVYVEQGEKEKAFTLLDEMVTYAPDSDLSQNIDQVKTSISDHIKMRAEMESEAVEPAAEPPAAGASEAADDGEPSVVEQAEAAENKAPEKKSNESEVN